VINPHLYPLCLCTAPFFLIANESSSVNEDANINVVGSILIDCPDEFDSVKS
jgi:hypothetical protein